MAAHALSAALAPPPREHRLRSALYPAAADEKEEGKPGHVVVEFSSPNVAKPFHLGHLRKISFSEFVFTELERIVGSRGSDGGKTRKLHVHKALA